MGKDILGFIFTCLYYSGILSGNRTFSWVCLLFSISRGLFAYVLFLEILIVSYLADLPCRDLPASASQILGSEVCTSKPSFRDFSIVPHSCFLGTLSFIIFQRMKKELGVVRISLVCVFCMILWSPLAFVMRWDIPKSCGLLGFKALL